MSATMLELAAAVLDRFDAGDCKISWMQDRLPRDAVRVTDQLPENRRDIIAWVSDPAVSIWFYPVIARRDGQTWWAGLPGNYLNLAEKRWTITHWKSL